MVSRLWICVVWPSIMNHDLGWRKPTMNVMVVVESKPDLLHVVLALCSARSFSCLLHRWQQQCDQNCNNCNHDQQFNERKAKRLTPVHLSRSLHNKLPKMQAIREKNKRCNAHRCFRIARILSQNVKNCRRFNNWSTNRQ